MQSSFLAHYAHKHNIPPIDDGFQKHSIPLLPVIKNNLKINQGNSSYSFILAQKNKRNEFKNNKRNISLPHLNKFSF